MEGYDLSSGARVSTGLVYFHDDANQAEYCCLDYQFQCFSFCLVCAVAICYKETDVPTNSQYWGYA